MNPLVQSTSQPASRRSFLRRTFAAGAGAALLPTVVNQSAHAAETNAADLDTLNFALQLEYLEGQYYNLAVSGQTLEQTGIDTSGAGTHGTVTVKDNPKVSFKTAAIMGAAQEIASDERNHVQFLRQTIQGAGSTPVAMPDVDLLNSFNALAMSAGLGSSFDPFADELSFLLGAFIFEDVGVTAYRGGSTKITNRTYLKAAAGILAVEAIHAGEIRAMLFAQGQAYIDAAQKISDIRDQLDGAADQDQGLTDVNGSANIAPTNTDGLVFSRPAHRVLRIVFGMNGVTQGGFFPSGVN